jgi:hypothetical protein
MTILVPIMLFGWVPLTILLFMRLPAHRAVLVSVIGGWLFLPMAGYNILGIPEFSKGNAIAYGLILGGWLSGKRQEATVKWRIYDLPMILWVLCPFPSSITNDLGWYNGLSGAFSQFITWGVPYLAGRIYFDTPEKLKDLCLGIVIGGLLYAPLCLYEFRMSPRLSINFYGFFPHEWRQHSRYGWWRPIVFMQHGLMVSLWMAICATVAFWLWRSRQVTHLRGWSMSLITMVLAVTAVLCLSANGWFTLALGCCAYFLHQRYPSGRPFTLLLLAVPLYTVLRISGIIEGTDVERMAAFFFDSERVDSLSIRLYQEDLFVAQALDRPWFGAGRASLAWPIDPIRGRVLVAMIDSLWLIAFSFRGILGLASFMGAMLIGPWLILRPNKHLASSSQGSNQQRMVLALVVILFMLDCLFNAMVNPVYILISGSLVGMVDSDRNSAQF